MAPPRPDGLPVPVPEARGRRRRREQPAVAEDRHRVEQALGEIEVVGRHDDDGALAAETAEPRDQGLPGCVVESRERLVQEQQPGPMQQRTLEREPLAHPTGEARHQIVSPIVQARRRERLPDPRWRAGQSVEPREELEVLACREFRIEVEIVAEEAQSAAQHRARGPRIERAVADLAG